MSASFSKATLLRVASFLILSSVAFANPVKKNRENYSDIIQKAQTLILQKNRQQALNILSTALKNERLNSTGFKEIKKNLNDISRIFMSEKAQQAYELSLSLKRADPTQAFIKINDAIRIEPENFTLLLESARQNITKGDCRAALEIAQKIQKINLWDDELNLIIAQTKMCLNEGIGYIMPREGIATTNLLPWLALEIEKNTKEKFFIKAKEGINQLKKIDKNYPEQFYWAWKVDSEQKLNNIEAAQQYKTECQNMTVAYYRRFILDPRLCGRVAEVEAFIKNQPQSP